MLTRVRISAGANDGDDDDESSDEDDDEIGDIPDIERKPAALNRRVSVSAETNTKVGRCSPRS